jgi:hypothetical protein
MGVCSSNKNYEDNTHNHSGVKPIVIEAKTWKRDSHGLFDYETNDYIHKTLKIAGTAQIFRETDDLQFVDYSYRKVFKKNRLLFDDSNDIEIMSNTERDIEDAKELPNEMIKLISRNTILNKLDSSEGSRDPVVHLLHKEGQYWIYHKPFYSKSDDFISNPENLIWYCIRDYRDSASSLGYKLKKGDILKFGRSRLRVMEICIGEGSSNLDTRIKGEETEKPYEFPADFFVTDEELSDIPSCRICFNECEEDNPLISPCRCSGSLKFIHYNCLKSWLESKRTIKKIE